LKSNRFYGIMNMQFISIPTLNSPQV